MNSTDQVSRLLALVPYLQQHPDAEVAATASLFGVTPKQLIADLNVLWYCGLPGGMPGDLIEVDMDALAEGRIRLSNADFLARPLRFTLDEASSLVVALRALSEMVDTARRDEVESALGKLESVVGDAAPRVGLSVVTGEGTIRDALSRALDEGVALDLTYEGASRGLTTTPRVDPVRLVMRDGYSYLDAWSYERNAWRTYRLDRIASAVVTDQPVADHGDAPTFTTGWLDARPEAAEVTLTLTPAGRWITEYYPMRSVTELPDGGVRATMLVADPAWLRHLLLRLGDAVVDWSPREAGDSAVVAARETLELYRRAEATDTEPGN